MSEVDFYLVLHKPQAGLPADAGGGAPVLGRGPFHVDGRRPGRDGLRQRAATGAAAAASRAGTPPPARRRRPRCESSCRTTRAVGARRRGRRSRRLGRALARGSAARAAPPSAAPSAPAATARASPLQVRCRRAARAMAVGSRAARARARGRRRGGRSATAAPRQARRRRGGDAAVAAAARSAWRARCARRGPSPWATAAPPAAFVLRWTAPRRGKLAQAPVMRVEVCRRVTDGPVRGRRRATA